MITTFPTYLAASAAAPEIEAQLKRHHTEARRQGEDGLAPLPDGQAIAAIIDATFWASFRPEEGRFPKISIAYLPPEEAGQPLMFENPLPLTAERSDKTRPRGRAAGNTSRRLDVRQRPAHLGRDPQDSEFLFCTRGCRAGVAGRQTSPAGWVREVCERRGPQRRDRSRSSTRKAQACRTARRCSERCWLSPRRRPMAHITR